MEISWITSLRSVNQFPGLPHFVRFSSLGFIVDQSIFLLRKMDAFFFFSLPQNFILDS
jgi:hypothetical protein